jgi:hypothetical protein
MAVLVNAHLSIDAQGQVYWSAFSGNRWMALGLVDFHSSMPIGIRHPPLDMDGMAVDARVGLESVGHFLIRQSEEPASGRLFRDHLR